MFDKQIIELLVNELKAASVAATSYFELPKIRETDSGIEVVQKVQPTQQGTTSSPAVYFQKLFDIPRGWPQTKMVLNEDTKVFEEITTQNVETNFQLSGLRWQDPEDELVVTPSDIVEFVGMFLQSKSTLQRLLKSGVRVLRIDRISNDYFENDDHQFEANPALTFTVSYLKSITLEVPAVYKAEGDSFGV